MRGRAGVECRHSACISHTQGCGQTFVVNAYAGSSGQKETWEVFYVATS